MTDVKVLPVLFKNLLDPEYLFSDQVCTILSNLTRLDKTCKTVFKVGPSGGSRSFTGDGKRFWLGGKIVILILHQNSPSLLVGSWCYVNLKKTQTDNRKYTKTKYIDKTTPFLSYPSS